MKEKIKIEPTKVATGWNQEATAYYFNYDVNCIIGEQGDDISETGLMEGYKPETMTDKDCEELAKALHTHENRAACVVIRRKPWTLAIEVIKDYYDEEGELIAWETTAYGEYTANGYEGRD